MEKTPLLDTLEAREHKGCTGGLVLAVNDTMNVLSGKWKLPIIGTLVSGKKRFKEIERTVPGLTPRMLSKELKDLEVNGIITRTVYNTIPVAVEYELTPSGYSLKGVLEVMVEWGLQHRQTMIGTRPKATRAEPVQ